MSNWNPIVRQVHSLSPQHYPLIARGEFDIDEPVKRIRFRCETTKPVKSLDENVIHGLTSQYYEQSKLNESQIKLNHQLIQDKIKMLPLRGWAVHFFDSDQAFRGRWDAGFQPYKEITEFHANEGFVSGPFPAGQWQYSVIIFSPYITEIEIQIQIETSPQPDARPDSIPFDLSTQIAIVQSNPRWYAGELQESTKRSNGGLTVQDTVSAFQSLGYSFLSIADEDVQPLSALAKKPQLAVIRGQIIPTPNGRLNALGISGYQSWYQQDEPIPLSELIYDIHSQGGIVKKLNPFSVQELDAIQHEIPWEHIDLLQIWEGYWQQRFPEIMKAFQLWDHLLNRDIRIAGVCGKGGDTVVNAKNMETLPKMLVRSSGQSESELLNAMKLGLCYSTVEPGLDFWVESDYGGILTGEELQLPDGSVFTLRLDVNGAGERCFFRIYSNDGLFCEMPVMARKDPVQMKFTDYAEPKVRWYRVELYRYGRPIDELLAFTNPVFVRGIISYR